MGIDFDNIMAITTIMDFGKSAATASTTLIIDINKEEAGLWAGICFDSWSSYMMGEWIKSSMLCHFIFMDWAGDFNLDCYPFIDYI